MLVQLEGITKRFGAVTANESIDLELTAGEIHALLGENGAGKSTLMKILYGLYQPDAGVLRIEGRPVRFANPAASIAAGIGMVHQHFMLVPAFTVVENVALGTVSPRRTSLPLREVAQRLQELAEKYGLAVDPWARVADLSVGVQQRVEILRTLYRGSRILIFDEPTAVLTPDETVQFLETLRRLRTDGCGIILITHKMEEVLRVADRVSVLRGGRTVAKGIPVADTDARTLAQLMIGRDLPPIPEKERGGDIEVFLEASGLTCLGEDGHPALAGLDLELRRGEILGIAGVDGNGQTELVEVLAGLRQAAGNVRLDNRSVKGWSTRRLIEAGVAHIPQDRGRMGLANGMTIAENLALVECGSAPWSRRGLLQWREIRRRAQAAIQQWEIRPRDELLPAASLSGGNQQKVVLARELSRQPSLILAHQPIRGLDVGAARDVHAELIRQRSRGAAILLVSTDLDEILALSDRVGVIYRGRIVGYADPHTESDKIAQMMAGHLQQEGSETP